MRISNPHERGAAVPSDLQSDGIEYKHLQCAKHIISGLQIPIFHTCGFQIRMNRTMPMHELDYKSA